MPLPLILSRRQLVASGISAAVGAAVAAPELVAASPAPKEALLIGHHFWNWDRAWDRAEFLESRLQWTRQCGYDGFEAKPQEIGVAAAVLRQRCQEHQVRCAAVGGSLAEALAYAEAAGATVVRASVPRAETRKWVALAAQRGIIIVAHPHIGQGPENRGEIETREDLLRYLDERPGVYACPDTGHLLLCGSDPVQTILDLGDRCRYVHLKDIRPEMVGKRTQGGEKFCELGSGALDLAGVVSALKKIGYAGWIMVERDNRVDDYVASARRMRKVLEDHGY